VAGIEVQKKSEIDEGDDEEKMRVRRRRFRKYRSEK
jgi:hypothetical protein